MNVMRLSVFALALGIALPFAAQAANLTVKVGATTNTYTLQSLSVDGSGNVTVNAVAGSGGTGTPSVTDPGTTDPGTTDPGTTDPGTTDPSGSNECQSAGNLTCVNTLLPQKNLDRLAYRPSPSQIYAFRIQVPASGGSLISAMATVQTTSPAAKMLVLSETPGDVNITGKSSACVKVGAEVSSMRLALNRKDVSTSAYCHLEAGKTYYVNAVSKNKTGRTTCTTTTNCAFYFEAY